MATGIGVDPTKDGQGAILSGMSSQDHRTVLGSLYSPGIISGGVVSTSASGMTYSVTAGVAAIKITTGQVVLAPIPATTITAAAASADRVDVIYARQNFPADGNSNVVVSYGTALPANSVELARYNVKTGIASTSATTLAGVRDYSIPYGATLGVLYTWTNTYSGILSANLLREGYGSFSVPTDRRIRISVSALLYADGASGFDNARYTEHYFLPNIDGGDQVIFTTPGLHQAWGTYNWVHYMNVSAGTHTTNLGAGRMVGPGRACTYYGLDGNGFGRKGVQYIIEDAGVVI